MGVEHLGRVRGGGNEASQQTESFVVDSLGFRLHGAAPALPRFVANAADSVRAQQRYVWSGRGALVGVTTENAASVVRLADESGSVVAEWSTEGASDRAKELRMVSLADDVTWNRGELSARVPLAGGLATLRRAVKASVGEQNSAEESSVGSSAESSFAGAVRDELIVSQQAGTAAVTIELNGGKLISWNEREPYGLHVDAGLRGRATNDGDTAVDPSETIQAEGRFAPKSLVVGVPRDVRDFGKGIFSSDVGLHAMGLRSYDPARGVWLSPDAVIAGDAGLCLASPRECGLTGYAAGNPVELSDPTGASVFFNGDSCEFESDDSLSLSDQRTLEIIEYNPVFGVRESICRTARGVVDAIMGTRAGDADAAIRGAADAVVNGAATVLSVSPLMSSAKGGGAVFEKASRTSAPNVIAKGVSKGSGGVEASKVKATGESGWGWNDANRELPSGGHRRPTPDVDVPHTQLGQHKDGYRQAREWGANGKGDLVPKRDIDFTNHGKADHTNPHQHSIRQTPDGRSYRGDPKPLQ